MLVDGDILDRDIVIDLDGVVSAATWMGRG